ncbi:MAG: hypothetical protein ACI822_002998, partial [Gammaproteobacteria bacterium]
QRSSETGKAQRNKAPRLQLPEKLTIKCSEENATPNTPEWQ